jgi:hypothetical protein
MNPVLPHKIAQIIREDGLAAQTMRAWMESITEYVGTLSPLVVSSGSFLIDDGSATDGGLFMVDDGGA